MHLLIMPGMLSLLMLLWAPAAMAWGGLGHRITGYVAEPLLTAPARKQMQWLLGDESLATAALYMDSQRDSLRQRWPLAAQWHYDNQPVCGQAAYCPDGNCATQQLERFRKLLANRQASRSERALALRLLVHLLGDIHQPLHLADNHDRGGNNVQVRLYPGGEPHSLHELLDTLLIQELVDGQRPRRYADELRQRYHSQLASWQRGNVGDWAQQTHQLAVTRIYGELPGFACNQNSTQTLTLSAAYLQQARAYLPEQLARAGARIAAVLNATLQ